PPSRRRASPRGGGNGRTRDVGGGELGLLGGLRTGRPGVDRDAEALAEACEPRQLVREAGRHRPAKPLWAALEVHERSVPLEVARSGQDDVRPERCGAHEHRARHHVARPLGQLPDTGIVRRLVARHDQRADLTLRHGIVPFAGAVPGGGDPTPVRRAGQEVDARPLTELEGARQGGDVKAAALVVLRPDEGDAGGIPETAGKLPELPPRPAASNPAARAGPAPGPTLMVPAAFRPAAPAAFRPGPPGPQAAMGS